MHNIILSFMATSALLFCGACDPTASDPTSSREGAFVLHSDLEGHQISSQVYRDGELVAEVALTDEQERITLVANGQELVGAPPEFDPRDDLERYHARIADVSDGLVQASETVTFRMRSECGFFELIGPGGNYCISSWCDGCNAFDCAPDSDGNGEFHYISIGC